MKKQKHEATNTDLLPEVFASMRQLTDWTGVVFEAQVQTLKGNAELLSGGKVDITLDTYDKKVVFEVKDKSVKLLSNLNHVVALVLGPQWNVEIKNAKPTRKSRGASKPKGTRSTKKAPRRRQK